MGEAKVKKAAPSPECIAENRERLGQKLAAQDHLLPLLAARFPQVFCVPGPSLAVGIDKEILAACPDIDPDELSRFLTYWVNRWSYRVAVWSGADRKHLGGTDAGAPTIYHRNCSAYRLWGKQVQRYEMNRPGRSTLALSAKSLKVTVVIDASLLSGVVVPENTPRVPFKISVAERAVVGEFNARSLRRAVAVVAEHGADAVVVVVQGRLVGEQLEDAGISAQLKVKLNEAAR